MTGFRMAGGRWDIRSFTAATASAISQGTAVCISNATGRQISEYSGGQQGILGFTLGPSANSLPTGKIQVAIPVSRDCTAWADVPTGIGSSTLSLFEVVGIYKVGGVCSFVTTAAYSAVSRQVQIVGALDSDHSRIEVAFVGLGQQFASISTTSIQ